MISVVIPLYNKAHTIVDTLNSVFSQTYQDFEIIIVDDGSTDNGVEVINEHFKDKRLRIIKQLNGGVSIARNTGIKAAKGRWIAFLDADDEWMPEYLEITQRTSKAYPECDMLLTGRYVQNIITGHRCSVVPSKYVGMVTEINFFVNPHVFSHISATIIRTELLHNNINTFGLFVEGQCSNEDFTFLYRVALHSRCLYIGKPLVIYNGGVQGQATSMLRKQKKENDNILMRNLVISEWYATKKKNKTCGVFMKYETRHIILGYLKKYDYIALQNIISGMNNHCRDFYLKGYEWSLFQCEMFNKLAVMYIYITKLLWRTHGYPVV